MNNNYSINNFEVTGTDDELNDEFPEKDSVSRKCLYCRNLKYEIGHTKNPSFTKLNYHLLTSNTG